MTSFVCSTCGKAHEGVPMSYRLDFPNARYDAAHIRYRRGGELLEAGDDRYVLANIELNVAGEASERFVWTCWISLSHASYERMNDLWDLLGRENQEPAFGWLSNALPTYDPTTQLLKTHVHTRALGMRPWVELEPTDHPLAVEQRDGIARERILAIYHTTTELPR